MPCAEIYSRMEIHKQISPKWFFLNKLNSNQGKKIWKASLSSWWFLLRSQLKMWKLYMQILNLLSSFTNLIFFFFLFTATPVAYESSQARSQIRTAAAGLYCSNTGSKCICDLCHSLQQSWILNPPSEAKDGTSILTKTRLGP